MERKTTEQLIATLKREAEEIIDKAIQENRDLTAEELEEVTKKENGIKALRDQSEDVKEEEPKDKEKEEEKENTDSTEEEEPKDDDDAKEEEEPEVEDEEEDNKRSNININTMKEERNFSLVKAIRAIANNQQMDDFTAAVIAEGKEENRKAGISSQGQIQLPSTRATVTVASEGEDVVVTDLLDILTPLRAKNVMAQAGAKIMGNLVGNVQVPIMTASNVTWEGEISDAKDGAPSFSHITLTPHRLTAYIDISKQMLVQDSLDVENTIRQDLIAAINSKLESTILGDGDGKEGGAVVIAPEGMFNVLTPTTVSDFAGICDVEADIEDANVLGECKYVMSNKCKAALRGMIKGTNATGMVYENGSVDGTEALNTSNVASTNYIYGDWSNLAIGSWGGIDLTVDPYTRAAAGQVRLVVNAFFDAKVLREEAFAAGTVDVD